MLDPLAESYWKTEGKCYDLGHSEKDEELLESFFAESVNDRRQAMEFCEGCPVQKRCLKFALETQELWGVWGGRDESEIRRDLWMNSNGTIGARARWPRCPWCKSPSETLRVSNMATHEISCSNCEFRWRAETTKMGLEEMKRQKSD